MYSDNFRLFAKLAKEGVVHREVTKNDLVALDYYLNQGYVEKVLKEREVYYQLTEKSLPLLEWYREVLLNHASFLRELHPRSRLYEALLTDLRFFDEKRAEARAFKFLGDWQLQSTPNKYQLALAQTRFFEERP